MAVIPCYQLRSPASSYTFLVGDEACSGHGRCYERCVTEREHIIQDLCHQRCDDKLTKEIAYNCEGCQNNEGILDFKVWTGQENIFPVDVKCDDYRIAFKYLIASRLLWRHARDEGMYASMVEMYQSGYDLERISGDLAINVLCHDIRAMSSQLCPRKP